MWFCAPPQQETPLPCGRKTTPRGEEFLALGACSPPKNRPPFSAPRREERKALSPPVLKPPGCERRVLSSATGKFFLPAGKIPEGGFYPPEEVLRASMRVLLTRAPLFVPTKKGGFSPKGGGVFHKIFSPNARCHFCPQTGGNPLLEKRGPFSPGVLHKRAALICPSQTKVSPLT